MGAMLIRTAVVSCLISVSSSFTLSPRKNGITLSSYSRSNTEFFMSSNGEEEFDFDVAIIGCGVGGHGAALHSRAQKLKTAVFSGNDVGGTCVNRGCVPSKALLAASGRVRDMKNAEHLSSMGIQVKEGSVEFSREGIRDHAKNLATRVKGNLEASLVGLSVDVIEGRGVLTGVPHEVKDETTGKVYRAKVYTVIQFQRFRVVGK